MKTAKEQLLAYISTLTPEQADNIVSQLPQVISTLAEQEQLVPQKVPLQTP